MVVSYRRVVGLSLLLVPFLGETFVCAEPLKIQQRMVKPNLDNGKVLTFGSHGKGPFYSGKKSPGLTDFVPGHPEENNLFDIFCSAEDNDWLRPGQKSSTPAPQRLQVLGSILAMPAPSRYQLRPCSSPASSSPDAEQYLFVGLPSAPQNLGPKPTLDLGSWVKIPLLWNLNAREKNEGFLREL